MKVAISEEDLSYLAALVHLDFEGKEKTGFIEKLDQAVTMIEAVKSVDTTGLKPTYTPSDLTDQMREDRVEAIENRDGYLANVNQKADDWVVVPADQSVKEGDNC